MAARQGTRQAGVGEDVNLAQITPLLLTYNEIANISRTLDALKWAQRVVVIDSGSDDGTLDVVGRFSQAEVFHRDFDTHAQQWNFGLEKIRTPFVLTLDADYLLSPDFVRELETLREDGADGWFASFKYCVDGRPLRGSLLPPRLVLFRTSAASYYDDGHTQRLKAPSATARLRTPILHDDRKSPSRWRESQARYAELEATKLLGESSRDLTWPDRLRRYYLGPLLAPAYGLIFKGLILDGVDGWRYTSQRLYAEWLLARRLAARRLGLR